MNIVCSIDNSYVEHCRTMLCSFFINNPNELHKSESLTAENEKIMKSLTATYNGIFFHFHVNSTTLINSGAMLVNLDYWRKNDYTSLFMDYLSQHSSRLKTFDQDVLNALLHDKCLHISCKWNVETGFIMHEFIKGQNFNPDLFKILKKPGYHTLHTDTQTMGETMQTPIQNSISPVSRTTSYKNTVEKITLPNKTSTPALAQILFLYTTTFLN